MTGVRLSVRILIRYFMMLGSVRLRIRVEFRSGSEPRFVSGRVRVRVNVMVRVSFRVTVRIRIRVKVYLRVNIRVSQSVKCLLSE